MMNATIQTILSRRSVRRYTDRPVDEVVLNEIVCTATYAPSAHGREPYKIVVVRNPETLAELDRLNAAVLGQQRPSVLRCACCLRGARRWKCGYVRGGRQPCDWLYDACGAEPRRQLLLDPPRTRGV